jgi:hypothetical protein
VIPRVAGSSPVIHPIFRAPSDQIKSKIPKTLVSPFSDLGFAFPRKRDKRGHSGPVAD